MIVVVIDVVVDDCGGCGGGGHGCDGGGGGCFFPLEALVSTEAATSSAEFWSKWCIDSDFAKRARSVWDTKFLMKMSAQVDVIEGPIVALAKEVETLQAIHHRRVTG